MKLDPLFQNSRKRKRGGRKKFREIRAPEQRRRSPFSGNPRFHSEALNPTSRSAKREIERAHPVQRNDTSKSRSGRNLSRTSPAPEDTQLSVEGYMRDWFPVDVTVFSPVFVPFDAYLVASVLLIVANHPEESVQVTVGEPIPLYLCHNKQRKGHLTERPNRARLNASFVSDRTVKGW